MAELSCGGSFSVDSVFLLLDHGPYRYPKAGFRWHWQAGLEPNHGCKRTHRDEANSCGVGRGHRTWSERNWRLEEVIFDLQWAGDQGVCLLPWLFLVLHPHPPPQSEPLDTLPSCLLDLLISFCSTTTGHKLIVIHLEEQLIYKSSLAFSL